MGYNKFPAQLMATSIVTCAALGVLRHGGDAWPWALGLGVIAVACWIRILQPIVRRIQNDLYWRRHRRLESQTQPPQSNETP